MKILPRAIALVLGAVGAIASAHAATYVVIAKGNSFDSTLAQKIEAAGGTVSARLTQIGVAIVEADAQFASRAARMSELQSTTLDRVLQFEIPESVPLGVTAAASPPNTGDNDFLFDTQWGFHATSVPEAWEAGHRGAGATVAVLDSGLDCTHPDLTPNMLGALNASFVPGETACQVPAYPAFNHGTHVAGTIAAADNGTGVIGVAPQAKFFAVKVLSAATGSGSFAGILQGIVYATDNGADVINMSLGVYGGLPIVHDTRELVSAVQRAVLYARRNDTTVIASAGNDAINFDTATDADGNRLMAFPGGVQGVLAISATAPIGWATNPAASNLDIPTSYTSYGLRTVALAAPGGDAAYPGNEGCLIAGLVRPCWVFDLVMSTSTGGWSWAGGTSMAAPHVSGVAALIIGAHGGDLDVGRVHNALLRGGDDLGPLGVDEKLGHGRLNAQESLR